MKHMWLVFGAAITLSAAVSVHADVLLQDNFTGTTLDAGKWNVIKETGNSVFLTGAGELEVRLASTSSTYAYQGIVSKQSFPVPVGQRLIVDFYGTNSSGWSPGYDSQVSCPTWMVSPVNKSGSTSIDLKSFRRSAAIIGGSLYTGGDFANGSALGNLTFGACKHCILTIDRWNVNFYVADTAYAPSMTPLYTVPTCTLFNPGQLSSGVFVYLLADRYTTWATTNYERFDGVCVSTEADELFQDDFAGTTLDSGKWDVIKETGNSVLLTGGGELEVRLASTSTTYAYQGVMSTQSFPVPAGKRLIVEFQGTNSAGWVPGYESQMSCPAWAVSPVNESGSAYIDFNWWGSHAAIVGGSLYTGGDTANGYGVGNLTYGAIKHCIVTIDRMNVNFYIADMAYTPSLTPLYVLPTGSVFSSAELDNGLFVYLLTDRYTSAAITNYERFDGVRVYTEPCSFVPKTIPVLLQCEVAGMYHTTSQAYKDYVISQLAPVSDILQVFYYFVDVPDIQAWIDTAHSYGMSIALALGKAPGPAIPKAVGPAHLQAPSSTSIRPVDGVLAEYDCPDHGSVTAVNQCSQNLQALLAQFHDLDYLMFDEFQLYPIWPSPFSDELAEPPYFSFGTYSDASLADFRDFVSDPTVKFPVLSEDSVFVTANPAKFAVCGSGDVVWNKWWSWRFHIAQRYCETMAATAYTEMTRQGNTRFKGVILFTSNRRCYDTAYNNDGIRRKAYGVAIDDVSLSGAPTVSGMASSPHIDFFISEDGQDQAAFLGPSQSVQYFRTAAMKYGKKWGNFLQLWSYGGTVTDPNILSQALDITTMYDSQIIAGYHDGVFVADPAYNPYDNYGPSQVAWWLQHVEPRR